MNKIVKPPVSKKAKTAPLPVAKKGMKKASKPGPTVARNQLVARNPWKKHRGLHKDSPLFDSVLEHIAEARRLENATEDH